MDLHDSRFALVHEDPLFAIDPTNPNFKATKGTDDMMKESQKRRREMFQKQEDLLRERKNKLLQAHSSSSSSSSSSAASVNADNTGNGKPANKIASLVASAKMAAAKLQPKKQ